MKCAWRPSGVQQESEVVLFMCFVFVYWFVVVIVCLLGLLVFLFIIRLDSTIIVSASAVSRPD